MTGEQPLRIVVIDDHELVRQGLVSLMNHGFPMAVEVVFSGESLNGCEDLIADVVLLDVDLGPGSASVETHVRELVDMNLNVLLISANEDPSAIRRGLHEGALGFIPKRVSASVLAQALRAVAVGEIFLSVDLASIIANAKDRPDLSPREVDALRLYSAGLTLNAVAHRMGVSPHTVKEYLDRVRAKYEHIGRRARTRTELYVQASEDGILESS